MVYTQALVFGNSMTVMSEEDSVVHLLMKFINQFTSNGKKDTGDRSFEYRENTEKSGVARQSSDPYMEETLKLAKRIERCLFDAKSSSLHCQELHLPCQLTSRAAGDILHSSADEPCGLRGALIHVSLDIKGEVRAVGSIVPDNSVTPTFELYLVFKAELDGWPVLKQLFIADKVLTLCPGYRLVKRKLYSSASTVVREFL